MNVFVVAENHVPEAVRFKSNPPEEYALKLEPALTASGVVVDEPNRTPVAGVDIGAHNPAPKPGRQNVDLNARSTAHIGDATYTFSAMIVPPNPSIDFQMCHVTSGDDGRWSFSYVPIDAEGMPFIVKKKGYMTTDSGVSFAKAGRENIVLVIDRGFTVTGRLTDKDGKPVAAAQIRTLNGDTRQRKSAKSDTDGFFTIAGVAGEPGENASYTSPELKTNDSGQFVIASPVGPRADACAIIRVLSERACLTGKNRGPLVQGTNVVEFHAPAREYFSRNCGGRGRDFQPDSQHRYPD